MLTAENQDFLFFYRMVNGLTVKNSYIGNMMLMDIC